ncbi:hypothetical protein BX13_03025 [Escherichia coli O26:H11 str. 2009C-3612]|nr:hypothetical protein BX09_11605 [Escherichia coli O145:H28 str. 2009C-3292]EZH06674.1 hypothetical protein BX13_03025 [Escherichia coli O26:H11 str. 2009C-3612]
MFINDRKRDCTKADDGINQAGGNDLFSFRCEVREEVEEVFHCVDGHFQCACLTEFFKAIR